MTSINWSEILPFGQAIGWTLLHSIWQIALVGLVLRLLLWLVPQRLPNLRYTFLLGGLLAMIAWCGFTFAEQWSAGKVAMAMDTRIDRIDSSDPLVSPGHNEEAVGQLANPAGSRSATTPSEAWLQRSVTTLGLYLSPYVAWIAIVWYAGVLGLSAWMFFGFYQLKRLRSRNVRPPEPAWQERFLALVRRLGIRRPVRLLISGYISEPMTFHFFKPVVLVPVGIFTGLSPAQVETLLLHELAHIRRMDYLVNVFQSVIEIVLFYHPTVWWISGKLREVREHACDDLVLQVDRQPMLYAEALTHLQFIHHPRKTTLAMHANGTKGKFSRRVLRLFGQYDQSISPLKGSLIGLLLIIALVFQAVLAPAAQPEPGIETQTHVRANSADRIKSKADQRPSDILITDNQHDQLQSLLDSLTRDYLQPEATDQALAMRLAEPNEYQQIGLLIENDPEKLLEAIHLGDKAAVMELIDQGIDLNERLADGRTALTEAAHHGRTAIAGILIDNGADIDLGGKEGYTALMEAAEHGYKQLLFLLITHKAAINKAADDGHTALLEAAGKGHYEIVDMLIELGADLSATTHDGWNAWYEAEVNHHKRVAQLIRQKCEAAGIDWEPKIKFEYSADGSIEPGEQQALVSEGKLPPYIGTFMLNGPIEEQLNLTIGPIVKTTELKLIIARKDGQWLQSITRELLPADKQRVDWYLPAISKDQYWLVVEMDGYRYKRKETIGVALTPVDANDMGLKAPVPGRGLEDNDQCRDLLRAVKANAVDQVRKLLPTADPDCTYYADGEPRTALVAAARQGNLEICKLLVEAGAKVDFQAEGDESPLMAAADYGHLKVVQYLLEQKASINQKVDGNGTALLMAARSGHTSVVSFLIGQGAEVNAQVGGDGTALICAARSGHLEVARILLENGADPFQVSPGDEYAMYHARINKDKKMIDLLKEYEER